MNIYTQGCLIGMLLYVFVVIATALFVIAMYKAASAGDAWRNK